MEWFIRHNPPTATSSLQILQRLKELNSIKNFMRTGASYFAHHAILDHRRNSTIRDHLSSVFHLKRKIETPADIAWKRQITITTRIARHTIAAAESRIALCRIKIAPAEIKLFLCRFHFNTVHTVPRPTYTLCIYCKYCKSIYNLLHYLFWTHLHFITPFCTSGRMLNAFRCLP